ncbi:MAG TPA: cation-translocating P-type ATPase [Isosphaeraceae bacterium]|nr:cation-translocating P-type ATPase [Isosphaeraceae bacterium]
MSFRSQHEQELSSPADGRETLSENVTWHTLAVTAAAVRLGSDPARGLSEAEASGRLAQSGPNRLAELRGRSALVILRAQFQNLIVLLLLAAAAIAFALGENVEAVAILIVIVLNAAIGFLTEWKAERALAVLQKQSVPVAHVVRDGIERQIPAAELVPGDRVILSAGIRVPADGRIIEAARLQVEEAALTGESQAVNKRPDPVPDPGAALGDRSCMAFLGTTVTDGRGRLLVTATGMRTEVGKIGVMIEEAGTRDTPLEQKLDRLGRALVGIVLALCAVIVLAGWLRGNDLLHMLEVGISLAIAAVPEGLPAVATMTLAVGMQRMARMRALIRRLPAVEALGSVTVICTDKTGTLTRNEMTVQAFVLDGRPVRVTGSGYAPAGEFLAPDGARIDPRADPRLSLALRIGALCNDARIDRTGGGESLLGDPTEAALLVAAEKAGMTSASLHRDYPRIDEVPFDSHTKRMVTVHRTAAGTAVAFIKGSPGALLDLSSAQLREASVEPLTAEDRERHLGWNRELAGAALRVLGLAYRELPEDYSRADLDRDFVFVGLVGMIDPLRDEVKDAIATCRAAGIRTVMITGDQPPTAAEIGRQLGLDRDPLGRPLAAVHARELEGLDAGGLDRVVSTTGVFARVSPKHKLQLVEALQRQGEIVAMTGDGVNDAPALKQADIGVAMGIKGTEVAKETADMIITDDDFATIVAAVEQGRIIYANILKFIHYLFSCNFAEILTVFVAILIGWPLPLVALQILWLNMLTDVFPALALALEPSAPDMMKRPPRDPREGLVNRQFLGLVAWQGAMLAALTLLAFGLGLRWHGTEPDGVRRASTMAFSTLTLAQVGHAFNARSQRRSIFTSRLFTNGWLWAAVLICVLLQVATVSLPLLRRVLHTVPPVASEWAIIAACSLAPVAIVELVKLTRRRAIQAASILIKA